MRNINKKLLARLSNGDLLNLLNYIKSDNGLRLEVRQKGDAFVYYRKGKALEIKGLKVDKKYGNTPSTDLAVTNPEKFFELMKNSIDNWICCKKKRAEFDTQQNIARFNQDIEDRYIILDMEYSFEQRKINNSNREKRAVFDLLGIDKITKKIVFFEVKKGIKNLSRRSGNDEHITDYESFLCSKNSSIYRANLLEDIKYIIQDKTELGLITNYCLPDNIHNYETELVFVFHPENPSQVDIVKKEIKDRYKIILIENDGNYKLK